MKAFEDGKHVRISGTDLVPVETMAALVALTPEYIKMLVRQGKIPAVKLGRRWWFDRERVFTALQRDANATNKTDPLAGL